MGSRGILISLMDMALYNAEGSTLEFIFIYPGHKEEHRHNSRYSFRYGTERWSCLSFI